MLRELPPLHPRWLTAGRDQARSRPLHCCTRQRKQAPDRPVVAGRSDVAVETARTPWRETSSLLEPEQPAVDAVRDPSAREAICRACQRDRADDGGEAGQPAHDPAHDRVHPLRAEVDINTNAPGLVRRLWAGWALQNVRCRGVGNCLPRATAFGCLL
jgi:hypothetical protein